MIKKLLVAALIAIPIAAAASDISEETAKHLATMQAVKAQSEAMGKMADAMKAMAERFTANAQPQPVILQPQPVPLKDCSGFAVIGCAISATWTGFKEVVSAGGGLIRDAGPAISARYGYLGVKEQGITNRWAATEARLTNADNQATLQTAFHEQGQTSRQPAPVQPPTSQTIVTGNTGPFVVGQGAIDLSNRPNRICTVFPATSTAPATQFCTGG